MFQGLITVAYILAALCFIKALAGLSNQEKAKKGNWFGILGMALALISTIIMADTGAYIYILVAMVIAAIIGVRVALKVEMTGMPELIAALHSFVGAAAVLVGFNTFIKQSMPGHEALTGAALNIELSEIFLGVFIGAITFTGSIIAFGKLRGIINSKPLTLPARNWLNLVACIVCVVLMVLFLQEVAISHISLS